MSLARVRKDPLKKGKDMVLAESKQKNPPENSFDTFFLYNVFQAINLPWELAWVCLKWFMWSRVSTKMLSHWPARAPWLSQGVPQGAEPQPVERKLPPKESGEAIKTVLGQQKEPGPSSGGQDLTALLQPVIGPSNWHTYSAQSRRHWLRLVRLRKYQRSAKRGTEKRARPDMPLYRASGPSCLTW